MRSLIFIPISIIASIALRQACWLIFYHSLGSWSFIDGYFIVQAIGLGGLGGFGLGDKRDLWFLPLVGFVYGNVWWLWLCYYLLPPKAPSLGEMLTSGGWLQMTMTSVQSALVALLIAWVGLRVFRRRYNPFTPGFETRQ